MNLHRAAAAGIAGLALPLVVTWATPASAGGGCHAVYEKGQTEDTGDTVLLARNCMGPTVLRTEVGTTVRFVNEDQIAHNVYGAGWGTDHLKPGLAFTKTFDEAGTFPYACTLHPGMVGAVEVGGSKAAPATQPVAATSDPDGNALGVGAAGVAALVATAAGVRMWRKRARSARQNATMAG